MKMVDLQRNPGSETTEKEEKMRPQVENQRLCDFCGESKALVYCRADSAKLCFSCDREVHSTNPLFTKHTRSQLCDICDENPASIHCSTDNLVLCQNCDWESHCQSGVHDRRPLEGFTGCPTTTELSAILGFEDLGDKSLFGGVGGGDCLNGSMVDLNELSDLLVWETPAFVSFDDLLVSSDSNQSFPAMGIPPLPKNRNTACGKYKEEIIRQLYGMINLDSCWKNDHEEVESFLAFKPTVREQYLQPGSTAMGFEHEAKPIMLPTYEANGIQWQGDCGEEAKENFYDPSSFLESHFDETMLVPNEPSDVGGSRSDVNNAHEDQSQDPVIKDTVRVVPKVTVQELTGKDRDLMISRYKEKRKTRRYDKHIRYESRKARAESRKRVKGRFAKVEH